MKNGYIFVQKDDQKRDILTCSGSEWQHPVRGGLPHEASICWQGRGPADFNQRFGPNGRERWTGWIPQDGVSCRIQRVPRPERIRDPDATCMSQAPVAGATCLNLAIVREMLYCNTTRQLWLSCAAVRWFWLKVRQSFSLTTWVYLKSTCFVAGLPLTTKESELRVAWLLFGAFFYGEVQTFGHGTSINSEFSRYYLHHFLFFSEFSDLLKLYRL